ncbi:MAG: Asp-tRNA(Asn)/Glu-tRNA(Gln) amidotransferase GatCAB subunit B [Candidatus Altiarchaeales archaeon ex4484_2]|nr:MAG: Asp-tRNA(Asn)/Glu-tRNA(Gln) amidotransferase GatCAB subunit B [Candidatus Altiarchaeales archaeon ex4484_2]
MESDLGVRIGLEIHVPIKTEQKLFCDCPTNYYETREPNVNVCPVCTGMPGSKPYPINQKALDSAVVIARLLECEMVKENIYVKRKHYDYPDLPSGYQRTSEPLGENGRLGEVGIWELHMEEDPGRYDLSTGRVDYNRSGVALVEIVTAPDMNSPQEARSFLRELMNLLKYTGRIIDVGGVLRADVNISLAGGSRVEIKNVNSVRGAYKAIKYEIIRQNNMRKRGSEVRQETREFNEKSMITMPLRIKETADDYRYIPDPDIPPLLFKEEFIYSIKLPETPQTIRKRFMEEYGIPEKYAKTLTRDKELSDFYQEVSVLEVDPKTAAVWICGEVLRQLNYRSINLSDSKLEPRMLVELINLVKKQTITEETGKKLLERVIDSGENPQRVVKEESLGRVSGVDVLDEVVDKVIGDNPNPVDAYRNGKKEILNYLMGQVMKEMKHRADADVVIKLLREKIR